MIKGKTMSITVTAGADLDTLQYHAVDLAGTLASGQDAIGVLASKPKSGEHGTVEYFGHAKIQTGGAVNSGDHVTVTNTGFFVAYAEVASGAQPTVPCGRVLTQAASGDIVDAIVNFANFGVI